MSARFETPCSKHSCTGTFEKHAFVLLTKTCQTFFFFSLKGIKPLLNDLLQTVKHPARKKKDALHSRLWVKMIALGICGSLSLEGRAQAGSAQTMGGLSWAIRPGNRARTNKETVRPDAPPPAKIQPLQTCDLLPDTIVHARQRITSAERGWPRRACSLHNEAAAPGPGMTCLPLQKKKKNLNHAIEPFPVGLDATPPVQTQRENTNIHTIALPFSSRICQGLPQPSPPPDVHKQTPQNPAWVGTFAQTSRDQRRSSESNRLRPDSQTVFVPIKHRRGRN